MRWLLRDRERGSEAIEAAVGIPAFLLFVTLIIAAGRVAIADGAVDAAAAEGARSASIARSSSEAYSSASAAAHSSLSAQGLTCLSQEVSVDTSGFLVAVGTDATVSVTVSCVVELGDVSVPGLPGSMTMTATVVSPLDTYRGRN